MQVSNATEQQVRRIGPFRRVDPFRGLMIDEEVWRDAHDYHRDQIRLHHLALHGQGIAEGLGVSVTGSDNTLVVQPGTAIDADGNFIAIPKLHYHPLEARTPGMVYLIIQYVEVPDGPVQPTDNGTGKATRIFETYEVRELAERDRPPGAAYLELARFQYDPNYGPLAPARDPENPGLNELDPRFRIQLRPAATLVQPAQTNVQPPPPAPISPPTVVLSQPVADQPRHPVQPATLGVALAAHGGAGWEHHRDGLRFLAREVELTAGRPTRLLGPLPLAEAERAEVLYLTGHARLTVGDAETKGIRQLLEQGGIVIGEGCADGPSGDEGARQFALSFHELAKALGRQLAKVERGHPLLSARHVFADPPEGGRGSALVLAAEGMVYSDADYGCAWQGGPTSRPLARGAIRDALEFGVNLALYGRESPDQ